MKVALFVSSSTPEAGGSYTFEQQLLDTLLKSHAESRHTFILYASDRSGSSYILNSDLKTVPDRIVVPQGVKSKILGLAKSILRKLPYSIGDLLADQRRTKYIINSLKTDQIDIILSLTPNCPTLEYPYIITVWDLQHKLQSYFPEVSESGEWDRREKFYAKILSRAAFIITGTETGKAEVQRFYQVPAQRIRVIPFFTPQVESTDDPIDRDISIAYNLPDQYLFYPAQFWPHKNHVNLLLAIKCLKEKYNLELPLVLVGSDKGNESYVKSIVQELDLSAQVSFLGFVPRADMALLYRNAFALIFLSFFGPDNLPPLEAMALGCPVIAANVSGATEQLGDAALLVDPKQPEEIAATINTLFTDSMLRQNLIDRGLKRANQWTTKDYIQEIFAMLDDFETIRYCWE
ncbi:glycosyltransferase family 1 protein [Chamaesiphon sp. OTE_75_metabat_556]|uniref:glycosyltransferase family 4 protein n=1 Tax=Chamaesiphon sp. OTE_75_metabat_556 TaxID=2964692 RepID=UPI00286BA390|nr:glycosyltransferase family 1 protein [Chamaesiphon sp. OTE_75_metabat_556]